MVEKTNTALALRLALARGQKSQAWLSRETGLSRTYICSLCSDEDPARPSIEAAERICDALGIKMSAFFKDGEVEN